MAQVDRRKVLTVRRDDHIGDPIGAVFLDPGAEDRDAIVARVREYLGRRVPILKVELGREELLVEAETSGSSEQASRLAAVAADLAAKGAPRNALALFKEAAAIDPLGADARLGLGLLHLQHQRWAEALACLTRARELGADELETLQASAHCCAQLSRWPAAAAYLERALELAPNNPSLRRALAALEGERPAPPGLPQGKLKLLRRRPEP